MVALYESYRRRTETQTLLALKLLAPRKACSNKPRREMPHTDEKPCVRVTFESAKPDSGGEQHLFKYQGNTADRFLRRLRMRAGWGAKAEVIFTLLDDEVEIDVEALLRQGGEQVVEVYATIENIITGPDPKRFTGRDQSNAPQVRGCCPAARSGAARADARRWRQAFTDTVSKKGQNGERTLTRTEHSTKKRLLSELVALDEDAGARPRHQTRLLFEQRPVSHAARQPTQAPQDAALA